MGKPGAARGVAAFWFLTLRVKDWVCGGLGPGAALRLPSATIVSGRRPEGEPAGRRVVAALVASAWGVDGVGDVDDVDDVDAVLRPVCRLGRLGGSLALPGGWNA